jgi:predicted amidohydrolase YtcJ
MAARLTTFVVVGIVAATLIAGLIVGAQRDDSDGPVDLIVHNARVYTADEDQSMAEAVAIRGNQILRVGSNREINRLRRPQTIVIDAKGAAVLPGFNDAHLHFIDGGLTLDSIDLRNAATPEAIAERVKVWADANPKRPWIRARGWAENTFDGVPARQVLDAVVADRPVIILSSDRRTTWVNTAALKAAGIGRRTANPPDGTIVRDARGDATGVLRGSAAKLVDRLVPKPTAEQRAGALTAAIKAANERGITSVQTAGDSVADFELYDAARKAGDLTVRVYGALTTPFAHISDAEVDRIGQVTKKYPDDPRFKTGAAQITVDADLESHRASLLEPYADKTTNADPWVGADDLNRTARIIDSYGWQVMAHATGDRAVGMALDALAHAARSNAAPQRGRRHRVEHARLAVDGDVARFKPLGVIASIQPKEDVADMWTTLLGPERSDRLVSLTRLASAGAKLALGSDWPESSLDPLGVLQTAVESKKDLKGAIDAYTSGAAYASFDETRKGSITKGMLADLVVLSDDIFAKDAPSLASTRVAVTIFDGKIVYRRGSTN